MRLSKNKVALAIAQNKLLIHLDCFVVRDRIHGTYLRNLTALKINDLFTAYEHYRRTGVDAMQDGRIIITFNNLAKNVGLDPDKKTNFTAAEKKEILADIQKRMDDWASGVGPFKGAQIEPLDPAFAKAAPKILHGIFKKRGGDDQSIKLDALAAYYVAQSEEDEDIEEVKDNIKKLIKLTGDTFGLGAGPAPEVVRLTDERGKSTGAEAPLGRAPRGSKGATNGAAVLRYTSRVKELGYTSKNQFLLAVKELGGVASMAQLQTWIAKHHS